MTFKKTMIAVGLILQWTKESKHRCPPCNQILLMVHGAPEVSKVSTCVSNTQHLQSLQ